MPLRSGFASVLLYAGQPASKSELDFDARGLIAVRLDMNGNDEATSHRFDGCEHDFSLRRSSEFGALVDEFAPKLSRRVAL